MKGVATFQYETPLFKLNVFQANGAAPESDGSRNAGGTSPSILANRGSTMVYYINSIVDNSVNNAVSKFASILNNFIGRRTRKNGHLE
jgi:hypothetical protein